MRLFRVFPYDPSAADHQEGGALYVPASSTLGRIANPDLYCELYFALQPEAAVAEVFGFLPAWYPSDFIHASGKPFALGAYECDEFERVLNLNDVAALRSAGIAQPSHVVTRDRAITQAWARKIFTMGGYDGVSWWSYYAPDWTVCGLWDLRSVRHIGPGEILSSSHASVVAAAAAIVRQVHDAKAQHRK